MAGLVLLLVVTLAGPFFLPLADAWGADGHKLGTAIALTLLDDHSLSCFQEILAGKDFVNSSLWADDVRGQAKYQWSAPLHFVNPQDNPLNGTCSYNRLRDCTQGDCVVGAVSNFTAQLIWRNETADLIQDALRFLIHFVEDLHNPLHVCGIYRGGNDFPVKFFGSSSNLHRVWDSDILLRKIQLDFQNDRDAYLQFLLANLNTYWQEEKSSWLQCPKAGTRICPDTWAEHIEKINCQNCWVGVRLNTEVGESYYANNKELVGKLIAASGVRLAAALNEIAEFSCPRPSSSCNVQNFRNNFLNVTTSKGSSTPCVTLNQTSVSVNCLRFACIQTLLDLIGDYDFLLSNCSVAIASNLINSREGQAMEQLRGLPMCPTCQVSYAKFLRLGKDLSSRNCFPNEFSSTCEQSCLKDLNQYTDLYSNLLGYCPMDRYGHRRAATVQPDLTSGEINIILNQVKLIQTISRIQFANALCTPGCPAIVASWYQKWKPLIAEGCISSSNVDLENEDFTLQYIVFNPQCGDVCINKTNEIIVEFYRLDSKCRVGLLRVQNSDLTNSLNKRTCPSAETSGLSTTSLAFVWIVAGVAIILGCFVLYILLGVTYRSLILKKEGWAMVPPLNPIKAIKKSRADYKKRNVESIMVAEDDAEDDADAL